ncbi:LytTR family DNA-binding domain-containing protein [Fructobacillus ficulneus]|uniref:Conserved domain protein n=1 Tax=Fructobacillus ficulneus TaxID=157463 RepID=A0A0K8MHN1_9LACO|nr:LytTR family DNA-binding domain-containing protein [Fructobacillus ficulneus]GAP00067.1 conserved domain protein [Fructobacillus ficulneus]
MKVTIQIDHAAKTPTIVIMTKQSSVDLENLAQKIETLVDNQTLFVKGDNHRYEQVSISAIDRIYTEKQSVYCQINNHKFKIQKRIYELRNLLPDQSYLQISQSEIVNRHFIRCFKISKTGLAQVIFTDGQSTFASRRYMQKIKKENLK